jgi:hypothetical protein
MKTPREVLLARHKAAEPKLDALREQVLATINEPVREKTPWFGRLTDCVRNCLRIPRFVWGGLAAAWLIIVALHLAARDSAPKQSVAFAQSRPAAETLQAVREQKRLLAELAGLIEKPESEPPRIVPRPRTERRQELIMV